MTMPKTQSARTFVPGHCTAFFEIKDGSEDPLRIGSRGAGICLSLGAVTEVSIARSEEQHLDVYVDGVQRGRNAEVTWSAMEGLLTDARKRCWLMAQDTLNIRVETVQQLPERSGWGMSGAGALSSVLALRDVLNLPYSFYQVAAFAHKAEVENATGLGDAAAQCVGGVEIRKIPGIPPHGFIDRLPTPPLNVVCLSLPQPLSTKSILNDPKKRTLINEAGRTAVDGISSLPSMDILFDYARKFSVSSGLASPELIEIMDAVQDYGRVSMAMLGNSIFGIGNSPEDQKEMIRILSEFGQVDECAVDFTGARILP